MAKKQPLYKTLRNLSYLTQFGFSLIAPLIMMIVFTVFLRDRYGFPSWIVLIGILIGIGGGFSNAVHFYKYAMRDAIESQRENEDD